MACVDVYTQNVVVVGNQPSTPQSVVHVVAPRATTYMWLTAIMMILCCFHANVPGIILFIIPALICACVVSVAISG